MELLKELSTDGNRYRAKKDRVKQRSTFRDILRTFENGELPYESLKIGAKKHEFEGWSDLRRLDTMRDCLGGGLQMHFLQNSLLSDVFGLDVAVESEVENGVNADEIRAVKQENMKHAKLKARSQHEFNTKQRRRKTAALFADH